MESVTQRDVFIEAIKKKARQDKDIIFMSADFGAPALDSFRDDLPSQFIHCGISEQHMIDMAAGMALAGKKVYVYAMAPFITLRCIEQIKCSLALMDLPVTVISVGGGLGYADAGPTHYSTEDIACMRSLVGVEVISPCDELSTNAIAELTLRTPKLRVIRLERHALAPVYEGGFSPSKGFNELSSGERVCILSYGHLLHRVQEAAVICEGKGVGVGVIDVFCVKPLSVELAEVLNTYQYIVTVEEHCSSGGFGSAILELLSDNDILKPVKRMALPERYFFENGGRELLLNDFGLSISNIVDKVMSVK